MEPNHDQSEAAAAGRDWRPFVSVVVPIRNEVRFITRLIDAILRQDYPLDRVEIIVSDGLSTDGTREILAALQREYPRLIVLDNPRRIVSTGLNLAVSRARGDVIVRIDGHAVIERDFVSRSVDVLAEHPDTWCVAGPIRHAATSEFGKAVGVAMSHPVGVGNALHRYPGYEGYSDGAQFPAIRRWVFERIGMFDEQLVRNQDDDFSYRIRHAGGRVFVSPRIRYEYFVRERPGQLFKQYFQYGFWRIPVIEKHRRPTSVRQMAPTLFGALTLLLALTGWALGEPLLALALPAGYSAILALAGAAAVRSHGLGVAARLPIAMAIMHAGYGWGLGYGLLARIFRPDAWNAHGNMATISR